MNLENLQQYLIPGLVLAYLAWRLIRFRTVKKNLPGLIQAGAVIVDVRSPGEYAMGSRPGSLNIPLQDIEKRIKDLDPLKPVVLCCASGARSGMAVAVFKRHGFKDVTNAGPWTNTLVE
jgi:rhodanese-related sulfurtransferase